MAKLKPFKELTLKGQKMRIVRDAITQIEIKKVFPTQGAYLRFENYLGKEDNLKTLFNDKTTTCEACAKGNLFASCVSNVNEVYGNDSWNEEYFQSEKLSKWFTKQELDTIEAAFECWVVNDDEGILELPNTFLSWNGGANYTELKEDFLYYKNKLTETGIKAIKFGLKYKNTTNRLLAILNNILKNGEFKP